jgi:DNA-binding IclR family transcriptional regulator
MEILRAFRPGSEFLGNGELAERTGLSRSTVSRLAQTLVGTGFLQRDAPSRTYRLGVPVLSLGHAMRAGSSVLAAAKPLMLAAAIEKQINVGLAAADRDEMVYLESIRYSRRAALRSVVSGQRVPMELTSLGRAWLAAAPKAEREALMRVFRQRRRTHWIELRKAIEEGIAGVRQHGYCMASWQPEVVALAAPIAIEGDQVLVLNMSMTTAESPALVERRLKGALIELAENIRKAIQIGRR